jgi:hypothetical protein
MIPITDPRKLNGQRNPSRHSTGFLLFGRKYPSKLGPMNGRIYPTYE